MCIVLHALGAHRPQYKQYRLWTYSTLGHTACSCCHGNRQCLGPSTDSALPPAQAAPCPDRSARSARCR